MSMVFDYYNLSVHMTVMISQLYRYMYIVIFKIHTRLLKS